MSIPKEPSVHLIGHTVSCPDGMRDALDVLGHSDSDNWVDNKPETAATVVEFCGRLCYKSFEVGLNPNVTKIREDSQEYMNNIIKSRHGSVLEHATATLVFCNVSRVFTHEIVRHRAGTAFSQESLRYVIFDDLPYVETSILKRLGLQPKKLMDVFQGAYELMKKQIIGLEDDPSFHWKKQATSAARRFAPIGVATHIAITANHRAWRHIIELRTSEHAEEELREVVGQAAEMLAFEFPEFYGDMHRDLNTDAFYFSHFEKPAPKGHELIDVEEENGGIRVRVDGILLYTSVPGDTHEGKI